MFSFSKQVRHPVELSDGHETRSKDQKRSIKISTFLSLIAKMSFDQSEEDGNKEKAPYKHLHALAELDLDNRHRFLYYVYIDESVARQTKKREFETTTFFAAVFCSSLSVPSSLPLA